MKKITIKYATERIWSDAVEGYEWLKNNTDLHKHDYKLFKDGSVCLDAINNNWRTVKVTNSLEFDNLNKNVNGVSEDLDYLNKIFSDLNQISTDELKKSKGFDAEFRQDQDNDDLDRMIKLNELQYKFPLADDRKLRSIWCSHMIGHTSMSVGDIVIIEDRFSVDYYLCDRMGWKRIKHISKDSNLIISRSQAMQLHKTIYELHQTNSMPVAVLDAVDQLALEGQFNQSVHDELS